jgi:hypothetical protein
MSSYNYQPTYGGTVYGAGFGMGNSCCCDFPTLIILILIILQFSKKKCEKSYEEECEYDHKNHCDDNEGYCKDDKQISNGILFIIALFFLSCCNPCRRNY